MHEHQSPNGPHNSGHVKRVTLPSGKTIEVVSFSELTQPHTQIDIHVCPECSSELVYPVAWEEAGRHNWEVSLRCPNCEWRTTGVFEDEDIQRFDETLDRGTEALVADLRKLSRANLEEDVERFTAALHSGHVLPEDF